MRKYLFILLLGLSAEISADSYFVNDSTVQFDASDNVIAKMYYEWNSNRQKTKETSYELIDGQLKLSSIYRCEYDNFGQQTFNEFLMYNQDTISNGSRRILEYNGQYLVSDKSYEYSYGEWNLSQGYDYEYDEQWRKIREISSMNIGLYGYVYSKMTTYTYSNNLLVADTTRFYDPSVSKWKDYSLKQFKYDSDGRDSAIITMYFDEASQSWVNYYNSTVMHDSHGRDTAIITMLFDQVSQSWVNDTKRSFIYEDEENRRTECDYRFQSGQWVCIRKFTQQNTDNGSVLYTENYGLRNGILEAINRQCYEYDSQNWIQRYTSYVYYDGWEPQVKVEYEHQFPANAYITIFKEYVYDDGWYHQYTTYKYGHAEGTTAVEHIKSDAKFDASKPTYDLLGRLVDATNYRGIVIQDGHKFLR